ncbi:Hypothetical predicted protein [Cloeon dipterum]|uniref:Uncharacterized protein n=1 Tax=Cloeon dipterum TaxID=197152 RepID=A0A8S1CKD4_9INSE|nr:Hypothetical predicted protein [Cloeon dipterum]
MRFTSCFSVCILVAAIYCCVGYGKSMQQRTTHPQKSGNKVQNGTKKVVSGGTQKGSPMKKRRQYIIKCCGTNSCRGPNKPLSRNDSRKTTKQTTAASVATTIAATNDETAPENIDTGEGEAATEEQGGETVEPTEYANPETNPPTKAAVGYTGATASENGDYGYAY